MEVPKTVIATALSAGLGAAVGMNADRVPFVRNNRMSVTASMATMGLGLIVAGAIAKGHPTLRATLVSAGAGLVVASGAAYVGR